MSETTSKPGKKYFTPAQANKTLPLVRAIVRDITELAESLRTRHETLARLKAAGGQSNSPAHEEELIDAQNQFDEGREQLQAYANELTELGVELKDIHTGLVDFPAWMDNREVYLCWRLGEPEVAHWHELEAGFAGRQPLMVDAMSK